MSDTEDREGSLAVDGQAPAVAAARDGQLTDRGYWDANWQQADRGRDPARTERRYIQAVMDRVLRRRLRPEPGRRFLEVGCGSGRWLVYFHRTFGYAVTGCDYSDASCRLARQTLAAAGVPGTILQRDLFALSGTYDVVRSGGLIEHFTDPKAVLEKFVSLLAPGGTLITTVPNLAGLSGYYQRRWKPETFDTHRIVRLDELARWYTELGLQRIEARPFGSLIPERLPRRTIERDLPHLYPFLWQGLLRPLLGGTNRACAVAYRRFGWQLESPCFSPYLYAIGDVP